MDVTPVDGCSLEAELRAPTIIVAFLMTACPACNNAKPTLEALKRENRETLGLIGIFAESAEAVENYQASYPRFLDSDRAVFDTVGAVSVPTILVAREGKIVYHSVGWSPEVGKRLEAFVREGVMTM
jgi:thiol-disulfide isomerase/thioredoxin